MRFLILWFACIFVLYIFQLFYFWNHLADILFSFHDNSKSEFIIYKLREMGKIANGDILQITKQFDLMDTSHSGKLTLAVIMKEGHWLKYGFPNGNQRWWNSWYSPRKSLPRASPPGTEANNVREFTIILHQKYGKCLHIHSFSYVVRWLC